MTTKQVWWKTTRAKRVGTATAIACVAGFGAWFFLFYPFVSTDDARVAMTLIHVAPWGVNGRIEKVNVKEGSLVKKGDILVELDHRVAQANYDKAKAKSNLAKNELERMHRLLREGSATQQAVDLASANAASADAELKLSDVSLENTFLKSPFDGIVVQKLADEGNLLEAGQTAIIVADQAHAWVAANIEETSVSLVKVGQSVSMTLDEGGQITGKVSEVRAAAAAQFALIPSDSGAGNYTKVVQRIPVRIEIDNRDVLKLRAGQSVEVKIKVH